jgi:ATP-binding cassette subfamily G (WHITE) protein 2 (PDR)
MQSPYTMSLYQQVMLCVGRGFQRLKGDASVTISRIVGNTILALVVGMKEIMLGALPKG